MADQPTSSVFLKKMWSWAMAPIKLSNSSVMRSCGQVMVVTAHHAFAIYTFMTQLAQGPSRCLTEPSLMTSMRCSLHYLAERQIFL